MSGSNLVRLAVIEEETLGVTPSVGDFYTARFTSENLNGSANTTESQEIRSDRMSGGQIVTGLEVQGDISFELAPDDLFEKFLESAMMNDWVTSPAIEVDLSLDISEKTLTRDVGDWNNDVVVGDFITLDGFTVEGNNTVVQVLAINSDTEISITIRSGMSSESVADATFKVADKITIGSMKKSFTIEKSFKDLDSKGFVYRGMLVNNMNLNLAWGEVVTGSFEFLGTEREALDNAVDFPTNGRTVVGPSATEQFNGSIDMPFIVSDAVGTLGELNFCLQSVGISLSNNLTAENCVGRVSAKDFSIGSAGVEVNFSTYLADTNWAFMAKKLTQEPFAIGFLIAKPNKKDEGYGFYLPAVQASFDDPSAGGLNQQVSLDASGVAKAGPNGEMSLTIYRL